MPIQSGLFAGLNLDEYRLDNMLHPMWWVSTEGALLLTVASIVFFVMYSTCCPARAGECSLNIHDAPQGSFVRALLARIVCVVASHHRHK